MQTEQGSFFPDTTASLTRLQGYEEEKRLAATKTRPQDFIETTGKQDYELITKRSKKSILEIVILH